MYIKFWIFFFEPFKKISDKYYPTNDWWLIKTLISFDYIHQSDVPINATVSTKFPVRGEEAI